MKAIQNQAHHDGYGLNDEHIIFSDGRDRDAGGASHQYAIREDADEYATIRFQHGPRNQEGSSHGITDAALIAVMLDRYEGFQSGPFRCRENSLVVTKLEEALHWMKHRDDDRVQRGVLGKNLK